MREIKFRGVSMGGHYVYGLLTKKRIRNNGQLAWAIVSGNFNQSETIPVLENSIAQLIGHDMHGNEVYEGDLLLSYDSEDEFKELPENGKLREAILYTQTNPTDLSLCVLYRRLGKQIKQIKKDKVILEEET